MSKERNQRVSVFFFRGAMVSPHLVILFRIVILTTKTNCIFVLGIDTIFVEGVGHNLVVGKGQQHHKPSLSWKEVN